MEITSTGDTIDGQFRRSVRYPPGDQNAKPVQYFTTERPAFADDELMQLLLKNGVNVNARPADQAPFWQQLLYGFGPTILFVAMLVWLYRRSAAGGLGGSAPPSPRVYC